MSDDLPFLREPADPSPEHVARAHERIGAVVHRRRQRRRRALVALPAVAVVLVVAAAVAAWPGADDHSQLITAGTTAVRHELSVTPTETWTEGTLSPDGRTLTIQVGSAPAGDGPCEQRFRHDVVESEDSVTVAFERLPSTTSTTDLLACADVFAPQTVEIHLDAPLGDRLVYDGISPAPRPIDELSDLVAVTWVPDGFRDDGATPLGGDEPGDPGHRWQQTFRDDGADWYFAVNQAPAGTTPTPEGTPIPITVHGRKATRYMGQMNNTMESIVWTEGGLDLTVWGEMQGPPTFTHHAALLRIAEGIELPEAESTSLDRPTTTSPPVPDRGDPTTTAAATEPD